MCEVVGNQAPGLEEAQVMRNIKLLLFDNTFYCVALLIPLF